MSVCSRPGIPDWSIILHGSPNTSRPKSRPYGRARRLSTWKISYVSEHGKVLPPPLRRSVWHLGSVLWGEDVSRGVGQGEHPDTLLRLPGENRRCPSLRRGGVCGKPRSVALCAFA